MLLTTTCKILINKRLFPVSYQHFRFKEIYILIYLHIVEGFEEELLNDKIETNSKIDSISGDLDSTNGRTNIVQQLLSSIKSTSTPTKQISDRNQVLSAEALQVLDELPNLSFMRAKVLMFPIINIKTDSN